MDFSKRKLVTGLVITTVTAPALAQLGGLGSMLGGGSKSPAVDFAKVEVSLREINQINAFALAKLSDALGLKEKATAATSTADDIKNGKLGISESTEAVISLSDDVKAEMEKYKKEGKKLDDTAGKAAAEALLPVVLALPLWKIVIDGVKGLNASSAMKFAGLVKIAPKIPGAAKGTVGMVQTGLEYLSFSGVDTASLSSKLSENLKGMT